jgi:DNA-binding MarR family transcriptional regulator
MKPNSQTSEHVETPQLETDSIVASHDEQPQAEISVDPRVYDDKGRSIAWRLKDTHRLYESRGQHLLLGREVTMGHWYYLRILSEHDGLSQQELSKRVGIHPNTAVPAMDNMEKNGLVTRVRDPKDRRRFCIHLTEKGRSLRDEMTPALKALFARSVNGIADEELDIFFGVLEKIWSNLLNEKSVGSDAWEW